VPDFQWSAQIRKPFSRSGIDEHKAVLRSSQPALTLKRFNYGRLQIHVSHFIGLRFYIATNHPSGLGEPSPADFH